MIGPRLAGIKEEAAITTTLNEMKSIKEAIRDRFYLDLGLIPGGLAGNPEWATRFLCLVNDDSGDIDVGTGVCSGSDDCIEMCEFLKAKFNNEKVKSYLHWDKYSRKGWRGLYMEQEAIAHDDNGTPANPADDKWYPILADVWFNRNEEDDAEREKHYYRIIFDDLDLSGDINSEAERISTRIVSFGVNGVDDGGGTIPLPADTDDDLVMFIFGAGPVRRP